MNILNDSNSDPSNSEGFRGLANIAENSATSVNDNDDGGNSNASDDEAQDGGGGRPSSYFMEGYTPLNINMNALVMMDGSDSDDDTNGDADGDDDANQDDWEMDGNLFGAGYYHMVGASPRRLNGVKDRVLGFSMPPDTEEEPDGSDVDGSDSGNGHSYNNGNEDTTSPPESVGVPDDFHLLAEQALRGLEVEHSSTLERSMDVYANVIADTLVEHENAPNEFEALFPSFDEEHDGTNIKAADAHTKSDDLTTALEETAAPTRTIEPAATVPKVQIKEPKPSKSRPMDVNAIQDAMRSIRLKSPQLATTLDTGASSSFSTTAAHVATDSALTAIINSTSQAILEQSRNQQQRSSHAIVPAGPLAAFRRDTPKAQAATANLSRSGTLSEAVLRLWPLICFRRRMRAMGLGGVSPQQQQMKSCSKTLTIHILGADGVECSSDELVRKSVGSFVRWMDAALQSGSLGQTQESLGRTATPGAPSHSQSTVIDSLLIEFSGPNMPNALIGKVLDLSIQSNSHSSVGLVSAKAIFQRREYHEPGDNAADGIDAPSADIAVAFNAGIWGYDSWKPTIAYMCGSTKSSPPKSIDVEDNEDAIDNNSGMGRTLFVITAYTVEECEDDEEVVTEVIEKVGAERSLSIKKDTGAIARQLWAPEANPFSSRLERKTASAPPGRKYFENGAWQAWLLGL